jgi:PIN domain nuclease of toxin-antitoxin system
MEFAPMIVLDTHIWLWWINEDVERLGRHRIDLIQSADIVAVSTISCFEVAWLDLHGRIELPCSRQTWFEKALEASGIVLLPITPAIAITAVELPEHHSDPQDRLIIATALMHTAQLMSADRKFFKYQEVEKILV